MGGSYESDQNVVLVGVSPTLKVFALIQVFVLFGNVLNAYLNNHNIILLNIDGCEYCICRYLFVCILTWVLIKSSVCLSECLEQRGKIRPRMNW